MSDLEDQLARYRKAILDKDRAAQLRLLTTYRTAMERLAPLIELVQFDINSMDEPTPVRIFQLERYRILERQLREEMDRLAQETGTLVRGGQADVIQLGFDAARDITAASAEDPAVIAGSFAGVPRDVVLDLVGMLEPDSPTGQLLASFGEVATKAIRDALTSGVILGKNPRVVAQAVRHATGMQASRALLLSRTEMLRSYRTAKLARYAANADILDGWKWVSAKQRRTCAACLAMDGETFPLSQTFFPAHPACRCTARPVLNEKYAAKRAPLETGDQWLRRQDADTQDAILGKQGGQAFRDGEVELGDFVRTDKDPKWGESRRDGGIAWARKQAANRTQKAAFEDEFRRRFEEQQQPVTPTKIRERRAFEDIKPATQVEATYEMINVHDAIRRDMSDNEFQGFANYKNQGYTKVNKHLRFGDESDWAVRNTVETFDKWLADDRTEVSQDMVVYRGVSFTSTATMKDWFKDIKPGDLITDAGLMSVAIERDVVEKHYQKGYGPKFLFEIYVPKGTNVIPLEWITQVHRYEAEVVLGRGTTMLVHDVEEVEGNKTIVKVLVLND